MASGTGLAFFQKQYPHRFFDVGIAEEHMITFAAGLSKAGLLPICAIFSAFLQRAIDNIFHDIALQNLPIIIAIDRAGLSTYDGPTHHGLFDIALLRSIPNLIMMQPKDTIELEGMLEAAVAFRAPCCIRYPSEAKSINAPRNISNDHKNESNIQLGQSEILQHGKDICIIALGHRVGTAFEVARKLPQFSFTIVNARFIKPLDEIMLINCAQTHRKIYIMEDHVRAGGFGSAVAEFFIQTKIWSQKKLSVDLHIFAWPNTFIPHASNRDDLEAMFHLRVGDMVEKIQKDMSVFGANPIDEECCSPVI
jgi:1-deoxy-D-xylulose-5-phosphate synthase